MSRGIAQLQELRVADVMSRDVVSISANSTLQEAANKLWECGVRGVPVVDEMEKLVGVFSTNDYAPKNMSLENEATLPLEADEIQLRQGEFGDPLSIERASGSYVKEYMNSAPQTVDPLATIVDAARIMRAEHIHHLVVIDEHDHPVGVITALDVLAAFVSVVDAASAI